MPSVLAIQSQVVWGAVGAQAATFPLQRLGLDVWTVPTTLLSAHAAIAGVRGRRLAAAEIAELGAGLAAHGALDAADAGLAGYLGSVEAAEAAFDLLARLRPDAPRLVDPVLGDEGRLYLPEAVGALYRSRGLKLADIATPNTFELGWLTGLPARDAPEAVAAARALRALGPGLVFVTSAPAAPGATGLLAVAADEAWLAETPRIPHRAAGAGDMAAALLLAHRLAGLPPAQAAARAAGALHAVIAEAARTGAASLPVVAAQDLWLNAPPAPLRRVG